MRGPQAMMRTPLMMSHPPDPAQTNEIVAWRRLAAAGVWSSVNRRPSIHSANTQVPRRDQHVSGQEITGRDSVISSPLREPRGTGRADSQGAVAGLTCPGRGASSRIVLHGGRDRIRVVRI